MSKQLAISATASVCAMALFAIAASAGNYSQPAASKTGAMAHTIAPAFDRLASILIPGS